MAHCNVLTLQLHKICFKKWNNTSKYEEKKHTSRSLSEWVTRSFIQLISSMAVSLREKVLWMDHWIMIASKTLIPAKTKHHCVFHRSTKVILWNCLNYFHWQKQTILCLTCNTILTSCLLNCLLQLCWYFGKQHANLFDIAISYRRQRLI